MDEEIRLSKLKAYRERDAARKREQRRLARLEQNAKNNGAFQQLPTNVDLDIEHAREIARRLIREGEEQLMQSKAIASQLENEALEKARALETEAKDRARALELEAEKWAQLTKAKCKAFVLKELQFVPDRVPCTVPDDPESIVEYIAGLPEPTPVLPLDPVAARQKRKRLDDARRSRKSYYKKKVEADLETRALCSDLEQQRPVPTCRGATSLSSVRLVSKIVVDTFEFRTEKCSEEFKESVWNRIWRNPRVKQYIPKVFRSAREASAMIGMVDKLQGALDRTKRASRKDHHAAKYTLLSGVVDQSTLKNRELSTVSSLLKVKKRNLIAAADRREALDMDPLLSWPLGHRKTKSGRGLITAEVKEVVIDWWTSESRTLPGRKDVIRRRIARDDYDYHIIHILDETQSEFYQRFKDRHPTVEISQRAFEYLKPYFVRVLKDRYVCCCQAHVQMEYIKEAFNAMRVKLHRSGCVCECQEVCSSVSSRLLGDGIGCQGSLQLFKSVTELWESCVCPKEEGEAWHKLDCINGECPSCGIKKLDFCPLELSSNLNLLVAWRAFEKIEVYPNGVTPKGRKVKNPLRIKVVHKNTHPGTFVDFVKLKLPLYIKHNFCAKWQTRCYQESLKTFPPGVVLSVIDFAENYSFQIQNEIQSMHWHSDQVTLLIHITYRHDMEKPTRYDPITKLPIREIIKNYHVYVSDDKEHDVLFVHHCLEKHSTWLEEQDPAYYEHWVWSDGAASQFKCSRNFYYIARHQMKHGRSMRWYFFGSGHGKGEHDGAGGVIKRTLRFEQLRQDGAKLQNAEDVTNFLQCHLGNDIGLSRRPQVPQGRSQVDATLPLDLCRPPPGRIESSEGPSRSYRRYNRRKDGVSLRYFWLIKKGEVNRANQWGCKTLPGTQKLHVFIGCNPRTTTTVKTRLFACVCTSCIDGDDFGCENTKWCGNWQTHELTPTNLTEDTAIFDTFGGDTGDDGIREEDVDKSTSSEAKASLVQRGDNFAVAAELPDDPSLNRDERFFILKCDEPCHLLEDDVGIDHWSGVPLKKGDMVLTGKHYQQVRKGVETHYMLLDDRASATVYASSVLFVNFPMTRYKGGKGPNKRYKLEEEQLHAIVSSLESHSFYDTGDEEDTDEENCQRSDKESADEDDTDEDNGPESCSETVDEDDTDENNCPESDEESVDEEGDKNTDEDGRRS